MDAIIPRLQVFEIDDQPWFPSFLRSRIQTVLTSLWTNRVPIVQKTTPARQTGRLLHDLLGERIRDYTVVDFCSGAGGPTPSIARALNRSLASTTTKTTTIKHDGVDGVNFVLTDIAPHPAAWRRAAARDPFVHYVATPVDAADAPEDLLARAGLASPTTKTTTTTPSASDEERRHRHQRKQLRTFHLSFHHFSDEAAVAILRNTFRTSEGVAVVELVDRGAMSVALSTLLPLPMALGAPFLYWRDPVMLFFTYVVPLIPAVTVFDGWMSCLRCRRPDEMMRLVERAQVDGELHTWEWRWGRELHTWPLGYTNYFVGWKK